MTENSEKLARDPIKKSKCLKEKQSNEIKGREENESPSNVHPELSSSDESEDNFKNHMQEQTQPVQKISLKKIFYQGKKKISNIVNVYNIYLCGNLPVLVVIIPIVLLCIYCFSPVALKSDVTESLTAKKVVKTLQEKFSGQSDLSLKIIKKSINKIINVTDPEPTQPSILLLMSSKAANDIGSCFAKELARLISLPQTNYLTIYGHDLKDTNTDEAKKLIDDKIKIACDNQIPAVVLLQDLDMLPAFSANILLGYCDHENAPCKKAVFIMTISTGEVIPKSADSKDFDRLADTHLRQSWHHVPNDLLSPLLSRITVSVAVILADKPSK